MSSGLYTHTTRGVGTVLTAAIYNADHQNHITNHNPSMMGGFSDSVGEMQTNVDPGGLGTESLASSLAEELAHIRFVIKRLQGTAQWYMAPVTTLATIGGGVPLSLAFAATPLTLRRTENNTSELEFTSVQAGSGAGLKYSRRLVGTGSNAIAEIRDYIGTTELKRMTATLLTFQLASHFNLATSFGAAGVALWSINPNGYADIKQMASPATPAPDHIRLYAVDQGGISKLAFKRDDGVEQIIGEAPMMPKGAYAESTNSTIISNSITFGSGASTGNTTALGLQATINVQDGAWRVRVMAEIGVRINGAGFAGAGIICVFRGSTCIHVTPVQGSDLNNPKPATICFEDAPGAGSYTYSIRGARVDTDLMIIGGFGSNFGSKALATLSLQEVIPQ